MRASENAAMYGNLSPFAQKWRRDYLTLWLAASPAAVETTSSNKAASTVKAAPSMKAAVRSNVDVIHTMEVMESIDEDERTAKAECQGWRIKPRVVVGIVRIRGRRGNVVNIDARVLLLDLPGAVGLLAGKTRYVLRGTIDNRRAVDHAAWG